MEARIIRPEQSDEQKRINTTIRRLIEMKAPILTIWYVVFGDYIGDKHKAKMLVLTAKWLDFDNQENMYNMLVKAKKL